MIYELWEVASYGEGDIQPLLLNKVFKDFKDAYISFQQLIKTTPCCIILKKEE